MDEHDHLRKRLTQAIADFHREQMSVSAKTMWVDFHSDSIVITLRGAACPAERTYARDKPARELLERLYSDLFEVSRQPLEKSVERIVGRPVRRSRLSVDAESGDHVLLISLEGEPSQPCGAARPDDLKSSVL